MMARVLLKKHQPAGGHCAWGQPSSSAVARVLQQPGAWHLHHQMAGTGPVQQSHLMALRAV